MEKRRREDIIRRMSSKSKNKGKGFEREIANHLSKVFGLNFERVPYSGAFTGGKNIVRAETLTEEQRLMFDGDISPPKELGRFTFECKARKEIPFHQLFTSCAEMDSWIEQAQMKDKWWFLIFKPNRKGCYIVYDEKIKYDTRHQVMYYKGCTITSMNDFFEDNKDMLRGQNEIDPSAFL